MTTLEEYERDEPGFFWWQDEVYVDDQFAPDNMVAGRIKIKKDSDTLLELDGLMPPDEHPVSRILCRKSFKPIFSLSKKLKRS